MVSPARAARRVSRPLAAPSRGGLHPLAAPSRGGESGYNLVILVVAITVLNILVAMALPLWRTAIKRDKEEELIFRGFQYAEAIRVFQHRYGRLPVRLQELVEVKPRCIRQLWTDPMTGKADWVPIHVGVPGSVPPPGQPPGQGALPAPPGAPGDDDQPPPPGDEGNGDGQGDNPGANPQGQGNPVTVGPIRGVRSRSNGKAIKMLFGQTRYDQWQFTVDTLGVMSQQMPAGVGVPTQPVLSVRWLGRPFRPGLGGPGNGTGPSRNPNGGMPGVGVPRPNTPPPPQQPPPPSDDGNNER